MWLSFYWSKAERRFTVNLSRCCRFMFALNSCFQIDCRTSTRISTLLKLDFSLYCNSRTTEMSPAHNQWPQLQTRAQSKQQLEFGFATQSLLIYRRMLVRDSWVWEFWWFLVSVRLWMKFARYLLISSRLPKSGLGRMRTVSSLTWPVDQRY